MTRRYDLAIRNARIFDGSGAESFMGDVAISGDRIAAIGDLGAASADREVDAKGQALAPGFIDAHTHDDGAVLHGPDCMHCKLSQGVTSVVVGNCGISLAPATMTRRPPPPLDLVGGPEAWQFPSFADYAERLRRVPPPTNTYALVGHMSLRVQAMDHDINRAATAREAAQMKQRLEESLEQGASGLSSGLWYPPSRHAPTDEVIAVGEALRSRGGLYVTHMRDEADGVIDSIEETLKIGRDTGSAVVISHHKCTNPENFGRSVETLALIDRASKTQTVDFDVYPYIASSTALLPDRLRDDMPVQIATSEPYPEMKGRMLADIAREWGVDQVTAAKRLLPAAAIYFMMDEADVQRIIAHPRSMIGSDGLPSNDMPHPRLWGTFPRVLGHYARDLKLLSLEQAVHKMTGLTAKVFGMVDRGTIREGAYADLVLFDPATVIDTATFTAPKTPAKGILEVWVNGVSSYVGETGVTGASAGRLITRNVA
ncbi:MAG: N-acyl-D-amino-acid deacylase family protein [Ferrovibrio sp.]|jgi:N-acyl-D-amino-acid deacylase|uniref:N-acyl-D-amino-acid deacylase family protein n=1 Tax=Ferrovibrio sp. TaxID=1917215 RepID=UPI00391DA242